MLRFRSIKAFLTVIFLVCCPAALAQQDEDFAYRTGFNWDTFPANTHKPECEDPSCFRYYTNDTAPYFIEEWPLVPKWITTGEFYSGSVPIDYNDPNRTLFFIFKPAMDAPVDEVTIWLNGGTRSASHNITPFVL